VYNFETATLNVLVVLAWSLEIGSSVASPDFGSAPFSLLECAVMDFVTVNISAVTVPSDKS